MGWDAAPQAAALSTPLSHPDQHPLLSMAVLGGWESEAGTVGDVQQAPLQGDARAPALSQAKRVLSKRDFSNECHCSTHSLHAFNTAALHS